MNVGYEFKIDPAIFSWFDNLDGASLSEEARFQNALNVNSQKYRDRLTLHKFCVAALSGDWTRAREMYRTIPFVRRQIELFIFWHREGFSWPR